MRARWKKKYGLLGHPFVIPFIEKVIDEAWEGGIKAYPYIWKRNDAVYKYKRVKVNPKIDPQQK